MCIKKFFDEFIKDNPTLENNELVVRKDNKKYIVKIDFEGMFNYYEVEENRWINAFYYYRDNLYAIKIKMR